MRRVLALALALVACVASGGASVGHVVELTDANFDGEVGKGPTLVVVSADWCTYVIHRFFCQILYRLFANLAVSRGVVIRYLRDLTHPPHKPQALQSPRAYLADVGDNACR